MPQASAPYFYASSWAPSVIGVGPEATVRRFSSGRVGRGHKYFYALLDGVVAIVAGIRMRSSLAHWGWVVVQGAVSVLAGVVALVWPGVTALSLLVIIGVWAIALGVAEIVEAFTARRRGSPAWGWTLAAGVLGVLFGIALVLQPAAGILALLWLVGTFALVVGVVLIVWAFRIRGAVRGALAQ